MRNASSILIVLVLVSAGARVAGAVDAAPEAWWSLRPLDPAALPKEMFESRVPPSSPSGNPIDFFIRAKLAQAELAPSPEADRRTLARRLFFDLTGLPPTPEDVKAFVADIDPRAYELLADRLLASPRYGEHWARHWLDVASYADTHGNDHDFARPHAWPYRDYVIRSLNDDKPYARFVQEQVAGDALFPEDPQATVALGFLAAGPWDHTLMVTVREDTVDHRMAQNLDRDGMVSTVIGTFQSLTVHCARCHDHKFDPISQREYYSLQAVFAGVDRVDRPFDADSRVHLERTRLMARQRALRQRHPTLLATLDTPAVTRLVATFEETWKRREEAWVPFEVASVVSTGGASLSREPDGSWFVSGARPDRDAYIVVACLPAGRLGAVRLEALPDDRLPQRGPGRWDNGNFHLTEFRAFAAPVSSGAGAAALVFSRATADHDEGPTISAAQAIDGKSETHWGVHPRYGERHEAVFELKEPQTFSNGTTFTLLLENQAGAPGHGLGRFRLSASEAAPAPGIAPVSGELEAIMRMPSNARSRAQREQLALAALTAENQQALAALPVPQLIYAVARDFPPDGANFKPSREPRPIHLLVRGELDKPGELVGSGTLACVPGLPSALTITDPGEESARRAALAQWLTDHRNVLTWRSIVNRVWQHHFGTGLCDTPNDFGKMGGPPSHPELLDWLALWFRDEAKGSLKALHRLLVTSATYRQTGPRGRTSPTGPAGPTGPTSDPDNRLLSHMSSRRLTAEQVRDAVLQCSGKLDLTMGGPSAVQFVARGAATFLPADGSPPFLDYENFDPDAPENRRRAVYRFLFRTVPDPFMDAFGCPDGGAATPVRSSSPAALEALAMLNDAFLIRQCEHMAARVEKDAKDAKDAKDGSDGSGGEDAEGRGHLAQAFRLILQREPRAVELARFSTYAQEHGLANAIHVIINSNEFLHID